MSQTKAQLIDGQGEINLGGLDIDASAPDGSVNLDSSGRLLVGTSSSTTVNTADSAFQIVGTDFSKSSILIRRSQNTIAGPGLTFASSDGTIASPTSVADDDTLGIIRFHGYDGSDFNSYGAEIACYVDDTPGAGDMPGRLMFSTTESGNPSPTERMRIENSGTLRCFTNDNSQFVSARTSAAQAVFSIRTGASDIEGTGGTTVFIVRADGDAENTNNSYGPLFSDERLKQDIVDVGSQWDDIKGIRLTKFRYKNNPAGKLQLGPIAQELEQVCPNLITRRPASEEEVADPSNSLVDGDEVLSFKASILYMKAVKALQEAMERIETLEASNADLLARVSVLEQG